jgi:hypothetical protein
MSDEKVLLCIHLHRNPHRLRVGVTTAKGHARWDCITCGIKSALRGLNIYTGALPQYERDQFERKLTLKASKTSLSKRSDVVAVPGEAA